VGEYSPAVSHIYQRVRSSSFRHVHLKCSLLEKNLIIRLGINGPVGIDHFLESELSLLVRIDVSEILIAQEGVIVAGVGIGFGKRVYCRLFGHGRFVLTRIKLDQSL
jgi:hypothetical protein